MYEGWPGQGSGGPHPIAGGNGGRGVGKHPVLCRWEVAHIVIGTGLAWEDLLAYALGIATVLVVEYRFLNKSGQ